MAVTIVGSESLGVQALAVQLPLRLQGRSQVLIFPSGEQRLANDARPRSQELLPNRRDSQRRSQNSKALATGVAGQRFDDRLIAQSEWLLVAKTPLSLSVFSTRVRLLGSTLVASLRLLSIVFQQSQRALF
jgi:hypothetical protein